MGASGRPVRSSRPGGACLPTGGRRSPQERPQRPGRRYTRPRACRGLHGPLYAMPRRPENSFKNMLTLYDVMAYDENKNGTENFTTLQR